MSFRLGGLQTKYIFNMGISIGCKRPYPVRICSGEHRVSARQLVVVIEIEPRLAVVLLVESKHKEMVGFSGVWWWWWWDYCSEFKVRMVT